MVNSMVIALIPLVAALQEDNVMPTLQRPSAQELPFVSAGTLQIGWHGTSLFMMLHDKSSLVTCVPLLACVASLQDTGCVVTSEDWAQMQQEIGA